MPSDDLAPLLPWQQGLWEQLQARRAASNLPHALLFAGPSGVGKQAFAQRLASALVCQAPLPQQPCGQCKGCHLAAAATHPDIFWLTPEEQGKLIRVAQVRALIERSTLTTQVQGSRVFVISPADAMNRAAANALLKTLEEPTAASTLILISSRPHLLPATIRSRCQLISFKPVPLKQASAWLGAQLQEPPEPLLALTGGAPLAALQAAEQGRLQEAESTLQLLNELKLRKINPMQVVERWNERPIDGLLRDLSCICSDLIQLGSAAGAARLFLARAKQDLVALAKDIDLRRLFAFQDELNRLQGQMTHNLNIAMLLEKIVTDWLTLTRPEAR